MVQNWERSMPRCILSPCLFNLYAEYILQNAGVDEAQAGIKITGHWDDPEGWYGERAGRRVQDGEHVYIF